MAFVTLRHPDLSLYSDPSRVVQLRRLTEQTPTQAGGEAFVQFEGNVAPSSIRGTTFHKKWSLQATYSTYEHEEAAELIALLEYAYREAPDARLQLRTKVGRVAGLDPLQIVRIPPTWQRQPEPGNIIRVKFEAQEVHWELEV